VNDVECGWRVSGVQCVAVWVGVNGGVGGE
jgi:hypothetical protein